MWQYADCVGFLVLLMSGVVFPRLRRDKYGPYDVVLNTIDDCSPPGSDVSLRSNIKLKKISRTKVLMTGSWESNTTLDETLKLVVSMDQLDTENGVKKNFFHTDFEGRDVCALKNIFVEDDELKLSLKAVGVTDCNIPPGKHVFEDVPLSIPTLNRVPQFYYSTYNAYYRFFRNLSEPAIGCTVVNCQVMPKQSKQKNG